MASVATAFPILPGKADAAKQCAASQDPFDLWYKQQVHTLSGLDMSQPPPGLPAQILDWAAP